MLMAMELVKSWYLVVVLLVFVGACFQQFTAHAALLCLDNSHV